MEYWGRSMIRPALLLIIVIPILYASPASALCADPTACYCHLEPMEGDVLVRAEVLQLEYTGASLRVLGIPFHDPEDLVISGQILEGLEFYPYYSAGDFGIFLVNLPNKQIMFAKIEDGGRYYCQSDPDFPGLGMEELVEAVLSDDCQQAILNLGIDSKCNDVINSGCCGNQEIRFTEYAPPLMLVLGFLFPRKRSGLTYFRPFRAQ